MKMSGIRQHVAEAIRCMQEQGGAGILRDEEMAALEQGVRSISLERINLSEKSDESERLKECLLSLCGIKADLGPHPIFMHGAPRRIDVYWLKCADVAIAAYDEWLEQRNREKDHG